MKVLKPYSKLLPCKLTKDELLNYGNQLGSAIQDIAAEELRQASMKTELKARLAALEAKSTELSTKITRKEEIREVTVEPQLDFDAGMYREIRLDTSEIIKERELMPEEMQETIPFEGKEKP